MEQNLKEIIKQELIHQYYCDKNIPVDIIIVATGNDPLIDSCLKSIRKNTSQANIFLWSNGKGNTELIGKNYDCKVFASDENIGFIKPNNNLFFEGKSKYTILLNSDVIVFSGWKELLLGWLENNYQDSIAGFQGQFLNSDGKGWGWYGGRTDFVSGWGLAIRKNLVEKIGLFDENLHFALCEDSDLCLRTKFIGQGVYALHAKGANHIGGATYNRIKDPKIDEYSKYNLDYFCKKWKSILIKK